MSALADAQRAFMRALFSCDAADARLEVYRSSVMANYAAALAATYPVVRRLVGEPFFAAAARRYAREVASASGDLHEYGGDFAAFLAAHPTASSLAYLADVARLEWACHQCELAPQPPAFDFDALARVPAQAHGSLRLTLDPSLRLVRSPHAIAAIHAANQPGRDGTPGRSQGPDFVAVRRIEGRARIEAVDEREFRLLDRLAAGDSLARAMQTGAGEGAAPADLLARFVAEGIVCGFALPARP